ncbi:MAG: 2Fe-2S iron-sulfur cluster-binding protein [Alphaproteobacteria bacterium]|nr:2Fe-2S iron-sulfur cluster-binding protein [Alphaproteobacteria bacterium]
MPTLHFVRTAPDGATTTVDVECASGRSVMQAAIDADLPDIAADCGGTLTCATCHVFVDPAWAERLPAPVPDEDTMLDFTAVARQAQSRLCCQLRVTPELDGLVLHLPASQY